MKKLLFTLVILFFPSVIFSQGQTKYTYGKISIDELKKTSSTLEPEAGGEIIYREVYNKVVDFGNVEITVTQRMKVFAKDKIDDLLTQEVRLYVGNKGSEQNVSGFRASVYNLEGNNIVETKAGKDNSFTVNENKYYNAFKFTFPNVKNGSVIEFKYTINSKDLFSTPIEYFQYEVPLLQAKYTFNYPEYLHYHIDFRGQSNNFNRTESSASDTNFKRKIETLIVYNLKSYKKEPFVLNYNNLRSSLRFELASYAVPGRVYENFTRSWEDINKKLLEHEDLGRQLNVQGIFKNDIGAIIQNKNTPHEKAKAILNHVQENYTWNSYYGIYCENGIRNTYKNKTGSSADINLLLVNMLNSANLNANPVVLSTVNNGYLNYAFPSERKLNFLIASYTDGDKTYLLDATNKFSNINILPLRDLNFRGFILKKSGIKEIDLVNNKLSNNHTILKIDINDDYGITGDFSNKKDNYYFISNMDEYVGKEKEYKKDYEENYSFALQDLKFDTSNNQFASDFSFNLDKGVDVLNDKILFNPTFFTQQKEQVFKSDERKNAIELTTPYKHTRQIEISIPKGYIVENSVKSRKVTLPDDVGSYSYILDDKNKDKLVLNIEVQLNEAYMAAEYYDVLKEFWKLMIETENQLISIKKK